MLKLPQKHAFLKSHANANPVKSYTVASELNRSVVPFDRPRPDEELEELRYSKKHSKSAKFITQSEVGNAFWPESNCFPSRSEIWIKGRNLLLNI